jgi:hypothetical protein
MLVLMPESHFPPAVFVKLSWNNFSLNVLYSFPRVVKISIYTFVANHIHRMHVWGWRTT